MKRKSIKLILIFTTFLLTLISGCTGVTDSGSDTESARLYVQCPVPLNQSLPSARSIIDFKEDTVTRYAINIISDGIIIKSGFADSSNEGIVVIEDIVPGTYTIQAVAYAMIQSGMVLREIVLDSTETIQTIYNGDNTVNLTFKNKKLLNNENAVAYVVRTKSSSDQFSSTYSYKLFDNPDRACISDITVDSFTYSGTDAAQDMMFAQDSTGNVYFFDADVTVPNIKKNNDSGYNCLVRTESRFCQDCLYYDFSEENLWYCASYTINGVDKLCFWAVAQSGENDISGIEPDFYIPTSNGASSFAIYGDSVFVAYAVYTGDVLKYNISYYKKSSGNPELELVSTMTTVDLIGEQFAEITDMQVTSKGELYVLLRQVGSFGSYNDYNDYITLQYTDDEGSAYSRGALIKMKYNTFSMEKEKIIGWYDNSKKRHLEQIGTLSPDDDYYDYYSPEMKSLDMYGPSYSERTEYFYGPKKLICIKPKELYIVDSGFAIRLADWTKKDDYSDLSSNEPETHKTGITSNIFMHSRIVKVNLVNFGLSILDEQRTPYKEVIYNADGETWNCISKCTSEGTVFDYLQCFEEVSSRLGITMQISSSQFLNYVPGRYEDEAEEKESRHSNSGTESEKDNVIMDTQVPGLI